MRVRGGDVMPEQRSEREKALRWHSAGFGSGGGGHEMRNAGRI